METKNLGPIWREITDPIGADKDIFDASKEIYYSLFSPEHCEEWSNFEKYILKSRERLDGSSKSVADPLSYYLVGSLGAEVKGMAFLTTYSHHRLAFLSYFGVINHEDPENIKLATMGAREILKRVQKTSDEILFETEIVSPEDLKHPDKWALERVRILDSFQKHGARKISWISYLQPKLDLESRAPEAQNLQLMILSTSRLEALETRSREIIEGYIDFVYTTIYLGGYKITDKNNLTKAKKYLSSLSKKVKSSLPKGLKALPLVKVVLQPLETRIFISYTSDGSSYAKLLNSYLVDLGFEVKYWKKDSTSFVGSTIPIAMNNWVASSEIIVAVVTKGTIESVGMITELVLAQNQQKTIVLLLDKDIPLKQRISQQEIISKMLGNIIYIEFDGNHFDKAAEDVSKALMEYLKQQERLV